jgi:hypothetical protein
LFDWAAGRGVVAGTGSFADDQPPSYDGDEK